MKSVLPSIVESPDDLFHHISQRKPKIITIDGRDGTGKTYLSKQIHKKFGGTLLSEKNYRIASLDELFEYDRIKILKDLAKGLDTQPVIFESCFMLLILKTLGLKPDLKIYIKTLSASTGRWTDEDELDEEPDKKSAIQKEVDFGKRIGISPSNFRLQMIAYHYDFKPQENSDIVYLRTEVYDSLDSN
jgi:hypothetical protein